MGSTNILTPPNTTTEFRNGNQQGNARKKHIKGFLLDNIYIYHIYVCVYINLLTPQQ